VGAQLLNRSSLRRRKVLLIDRCQATREARAAVLRTHNIDVQEVEDFAVARHLWRPNVYGLVMIDARRYSPGETLEFCDKIRDASPGQRFIFLLGPPRYVSRTWSGEITADSGTRGQWGETVKRFLAAA
jgi:response regulator RpfG family c-di-GMP phosphodiesterase